MLLHISNTDARKTQYLSAMHVINSLIFINFVSRSSVHIFLSSLRSRIDMLTLQNIETNTIFTISRITVLKCAIPIVDFHKNPFDQAFPNNPLTFCDILNQHLLTQNLKVQNAPTAKFSKYGNLNFPRNLTLLQAFNFMGSLNTSAAPCYMEFWCTAES